MLALPSRSVRAELPTDSLDGTKRQEDELLAGQVRIEAASF
jgi:hypothetical protein